jgi:predicted  nucleic acid-binding Zn-ribbon protein
MKKLLLLSSFLLAGYFSNHVKANSNDSLHVLKVKLETVEKQVQQLQSALQSLRTTDSALVAELKAIRKSTPAPKPKQLVIDRRGSKQAHWQ